MVMRELGEMKKLRVLYLEMNPMAKSGDYRRKTIIALPQIRRLDAILCRAENEDDDPNETDTTQSSDADED